MPALQLPNPPPSSTAVRNVMRANRAKDTGPEVRLRRGLREVGLGGYRLNWRKAAGRPDIAYPGRRMAIFVHGCFWHHCPRCYPSLPKSNSAFWERKFSLNLERDQRKRKALEDAGWLVEEVWEHELTSSSQQVIRRIQERLAI
jgi:DNA mismatch endonuclease (patch repair protein)